MSPENSHTPPNIFPALVTSAVIVILWVIPVFAPGGRAGTTGAGAWGFISIIALLATIISPLVYGWLSRDSTGAIVIGALPFLLVTGVARIVSPPGPAEAGFLAWSVVYILSLSLVGGLEGYFAARKTTGNVLIALLLAALWAGIFFSGIH